MEAVMTQSEKDPENYHVTTQWPCDLARRDPGTVHLSARVHKEDPRGSRR